MRLWWRPWCLCAQLRCWRHSKWLDYCNYSVMEITHCSRQPTKLLPASRHARSDSSSISVTLIIPNHTSTRATVYTWSTTIKASHDISVDRSHCAWLNIYNGSSYLLRSPKIHASSKMKFWICHWCYVSLAKYDFQSLVDPPEKKPVSGYKNNLMHCLAKLLSVKAIQPCYQNGVITKQYFLNVVCLSTMVYCSCFAGLTLSVHMHVLVTGVCLIW